MVTTKTVAVGTIETTAVTFASMVNNLRASIGRAAHHMMVVGDRLCYVEGAEVVGDHVHFTTSYGPDRTVVVHDATDIVFFA